MKKIKFYVCFYGIVYLLSLSGVFLMIMIEKLRMFYPDFFEIKAGKALLLVIAAVWMTLLIHELTHAVVYKLYGISLRMFYVFPICVIKETEGIQVSLAASLAFGIGGLAIPELAPVQDETEIVNIRKK